jgi:hypothetical protein
MALTRRKFLAGSGTRMGGLALSSLGIDEGGGTPSLRPYLRFVNLLLT